MFDENSFSLSSFDQDSWLFLLVTPYSDLSPRQRMVVRSALESAYSVEVADDVVSFAAVQSLSVLDAMQAIGVRTQAIEWFRLSTTCPWAALAMVSACALDKTRLSAV